VPLHLHAEVEVSITVNVARSEDEAARQARGEDVTAINYDDEANEAFVAEQQAAQAEMEAENG
jgi:large subunit ribosomal protein L9